jgi:hypothetical protein
MTQITDLTRRAGQQRWRYATGLERKVVGSQLAPYRLTKEEACKRLAKARAVQQQQRFYQLNLSARPKIPK